MLKVATSGLSHAVTSCGQSSSLPRHLVSESGLKLGWKLCSAGSEELAAETAAQLVSEAMSCGAPSSRKCSLFAPVPTTASPLGIQEY